MNVQDDTPQTPGRSAEPAPGGAAKPQARKGRATDGTGGGAPASREDRLKAALKANMGRRKAQARARAASADNNEKE